MEVSRRKIWFTMLLSLWQNAYGYATILIPSLLTAPRYFRGEIEFGVISQVLCPHYALCTRYKPCVTLVRN